MAELPSIINMFHWTSKRKQHSSELVEGARAVVRFDSPDDLDAAIDFDAAPDTPHLDLIRTGVGVLADNYPSFDVTTTSGFVFKSGGCVQLYLEFQGIVHSCRGFYKVTVFDVDKVAAWVQSNDEYRNSWRSTCDNVICGDSFPCGIVLLWILVLVILSLLGAVYSLITCGHLHCHPDKAAQAIIDLAMSHVNTR